MPSVSSAVLQGTDVADEDMEAEIDELPEGNEPEGDEVVEDEVPEGDEVTEDQEVSPEELAESEEKQQEEEPPSEDEGTGEEELPAEEEGATGASRTQARMRSLAAEAGRAKKFAPILEMLEENPALARELVARRLGLETAPAARAEVPATRVPTAEEQANLRMYWEGELKKDPAGALMRMITWAQQQVVAPQAAVLAKANAETLVDGYKARLVSADPDRWPEVEPYFDALIEQADPQVLIQNPRRTLDFLRRNAYGAWMEDQEKKIAKARARATATGRTTMGRRVNPRTRLTTATAAGGGNQRTLAQATRRMSDEERSLADRYPEFASAITEEE
jgi:hypothetical protein